MSRTVEATEKNKNKKRKLNVLDIITLSVIAILASLYAPRAWSLYEERRAMLEEAKKPPVIEYPLEVEITDQDAQFFIKFFNVGMVTPLTYLYNKESCIARILASTFIFMSFS